MARIAEAAMPTRTSPELPSAVHRPLPRGIWVLGFVSLLMDVSSEMIHSLLPLFLVGTLGVSAFALGLLEGVAEATALFMKMAAGTLSDYLGRRKGLAVLGYAMGALSKPAFALAQGPGLVYAARIVDRMGKGIRGAPRDALVADLVPADQRGAAFGLRQALDTVGAFIGPLLAMGLMLLWANDFRAVFWVAVIPALLAVALLVVGIREPAVAPHAGPRNPIHRENLKRMGSAFWWVVAIGALFTLARFSEAFLVLRAENAGMKLAFVPLVMVVMSAVYSATAYPFGRLADRLPHRPLLMLALALLIVADLVLAFGAHWSSVILGVMLWGLHMGLSQGLLATMVAGSAPADLRGTAFGLFNLASGIAMLLASGIAGWLWQSMGPQSTFLAGAGFSAAALLLLALQRRA